MRILLVSDLHYTLPQLDWVVRAAPSFDLVAVVGDSLDIASAVPLEAQTAVLLRYFDLLHRVTRVAVGSGNHDLTGPDAAGEQSALWLQQAREASVPVDGDTLSLDSARVTICPWWDGPIGRDAVERQFERDAGHRGAHWIWLYHWPPLGTPTCWNGRRDYGDTELPGWIERFRPDIVLTGHVHESPFKPNGHWAHRLGDTWVFNAGRQIGPVPAHITLDLGAGEACWHSMMGSETLSLRQATAPARTVF